MMHPDTEVRFISPEKGHGVIALRPIPKGTITWALDALDRTFTPAQVTAMDTIYRQIIHKYSYRNRVGDFVLCWDHGRYVNHSSRSNCVTTAYEFELAVRDITAGEELTDDYGFLNLEEPFDCTPEPGATRTHIMPDDLLRYHETWDAQLEDAFRSFNEVEQPLLVVLREETRRTAIAIASGEREMDSILDCYCGR